VLDPPEHRHSAKIFAWMTVLRSSRIWIWLPVQWRG
jgi:hypothetical protein